LPHLKTAFTKYQNDPGVVFVLASIDEDEKRLQRFLNEMRFPFTVVRANKDEAQQKMGIDDVPATFYVDREGIVRFEVRGLESHGDSRDRVGWYLDQLKNGM
jgi:Thioredoxin-like